MKTKSRIRCTLAGTGLALLAVWSAPAAALQVVVTIENLSPVNGTFLTPVWVGFHNGQFDLYDSGSPISAELERLAEDGNTAPISTAFSNSGFGGPQGTIAGPGGPLAPGQITSMSFTLDSNNPSNAYFSFASMIIPSNDAFVANGNPMAYSLFDAGGNFNAIDFFITGANVLDAGSEVNDESPMNTAFFGQATPDTGTTENGVVGLHPGFLPAGSGGILDSAMFANADFTRAGYPIAQIRISAVPLPAGIWLLLSGAGALVAFRRKGSRN